MQLRVFFLQYDVVVIYPALYVSDNKVKDKHVNEQQKAHKIKKMWWAIEKQRKLVMKLIIH